ncbi:hypothetical protein H4R23_001190 [Coemansia sp. Cherry 401B]|nr:hypothetical protein IWW54_000409 [Coemansia sp. RSA 2705]KAJ2738377.1 hypothetical protein H4R23_001190 [Coemansia sp. Cherry 401B]
MLGKPTGASQLKLTLGLRFLDLLDMTDLDWKFLTHFTCRCPISLGKLLQLIARLPRLVDLKLVTIRLDSIQTAAAVDELFQRHVGDSALDLNIRKLSITLCIFEVSQEVAYEALCNFAVYCPQLQVFGVPAALQTDVSAFIESYGLEFPHLGRVVIE